MTSSSPSPSASAAALSTNGLAVHSPVSPPPQSALQQNDCTKSWIVQKFGGTSVARVPVDIAEDIVKHHLADHRVVVVCSARSTGSKLEGTTNKLLRAAREAGQPGSSSRFEDSVNAICNDHIRAARANVRSPQLATRLVQEIESECRELVSFLAAVQKVGEVSSRTLDTVVSMGEKLSCHVMATLLEDCGVDATYVDLSGVVSFQSPQGLDQEFYANLTAALTERILACGSSIPVVTGYFGAVQGGLLKCIGRGYTDLCAALIAVGLQAEELQVWKEVDGIFTANPHKVPTARLLPTISPAEAAELTYYGSEVIHPFTMEQVIRARIPIRIRNVTNLRNSGTLILPEPAPPDSPNGVHTPSSTSNGTGGPSTPTFRTRSSSQLLNGIASHRNNHSSSSSFSSHQYPLSAHQRPKRPTAVTIKHKILVLNVHSNKRTLSHGFFAGIFSVLDKWRLSVDLISTSEVHVSMALHSESALVSGSGGADPEFKDIVDADLRGAVEELAGFGTVDIGDGMAILSLVGRQMKNMVGIAGRMFSVLGENNVNIEMISQGASEINISCVIDERDADRAINILHTNLFTFLD